MEVCVGLVGMRGPVTALCWAALATPHSGGCKDLRPHRAPSAHTLWWAFTLGVKLDAAICRIRECKSVCKRLWECLKGPVALY